MTLGSLSGLVVVGGVDGELAEQFAVSGIPPKRGGIPYEEW
ncbi:MAG: hypothetical protein ACRDTT_08520 [Pseudonocardiaceae bacterium]